MPERGEWRPAEVYERIAELVRETVPKRQIPEQLLDEIYRDATDLERRLATDIVQPARRAAAAARS
jgi:hypothetical protein